MDTMDRLNEGPDSGDELVVLGEVSQDTRGTFLGFFADPGGARRIFPF